MDAQPRTAAGHVRGYLRSAGWAPDPPGPAGEMWRQGATAIAVPWELQQGTAEWHGVIDRIAAAEHRTPAEAAAAVFRAAGTPAGLYLCGRCESAPATLLLAAATSHGTTLTLLCEADAPTAAAAAASSGAAVRLLALTEVPA